MPLRLISFLVGFLLAGSARADVTTGCPSGFVMGGGGECYWTQIAFDSASLIWPGLTWQNYRLECYDLWNANTPAGSGTNIYYLEFSEGSPATFATTGYVWQYATGVNSTAGAVGNTSDVGFALVNATVNQPTVTSTAVVEFGPLARASEVKMLTGRAVIHNGTNVMAATIGGYYTHSQNPINGVKVLNSPAGHFYAICTLYAKPGG